MSDGVVVSDNISFVNLKSAIVAELDVDERKKKLLIRYVVEENFSPITIRNDMGVRLYIEIKKREPGFRMYPLCIDTSDVNLVESQRLDPACPSMDCGESKHSDKEILGVMESPKGVCYYGTEEDVGNASSGATNIEVKEKQKYRDKATLVCIMGKYKIEKGFNFRVKRSNSRSYVLTCFSEDCGWRMKASRMKNTDVFIIRYFNDIYTCPMRKRILNNVEATLSFISGVTAPKLLNHKRSHTPKDIVTDVKDAFGVNITYQKAWQEKKRALEMLRGKPTDGYRMMPKYIHMLNKVYPKSYIRLKKSEEKQFMYLFIALRPLVRGFQFCRLVVIVDGAHLSGAYRGTFLSASTVDGSGIK